ncbi:putative quinol monooxygenase [Novosphingobium sp. AP12]|uniref:putative quinol monooxygenase n=1 Tax=Novosphingobium sp. AP12 TaxID=1144305 RepID=UPI0012F918AF
MLIVGTAALALATLPAATAKAPDGAGYHRVPPAAFSVVAEVQAKAGKEAALREVTLPLIDLVRSDPKNLYYFLQEDREKPGHFVFYEVFATREDFEAHNRMPYVLDWFEKIKPLVVADVKAMKMEVLQHP